MFFNTFVVIIYIKKKYSESFFIIIFSTYDIIQTIDDIIENYLDIIIKERCFFLESNSDYMILLSKDMDGISAGINAMEEILGQVLHNYFNKKQFEENIKILPFRLYSCNKSKKISYG